MLRQISDYLFMGSLILLVITVFAFFSGSGGMASFTKPSNYTGATIDLQMNHDHKKQILNQDNMVVRLLKSYFFWIPIVGLLSSIVLSLI